MINGIHHPSLVTADLERSLSFWRDLLGFEQVFDMGWEAGSEMSQMAIGITGVKNSGVKAVTLKAGSGFVEIFEYAHPRPQRDQAPTLADMGIAHICLDVSNIHAVYEKLTDAGVVFVGEPVEAGPMTICFLPRFLSRLYPQSANSF